MERTPISWFGIAWVAAVAIAVALVSIGSTDALGEAALVLLTPYLIRELLPRRRARLSDHE